MLAFKSRTKLICYLDYEDAKQIVHILGNLPLAIDQAGAYLNKLAKPLASFAPLFEANFNSTLSKKPPAALWQYGERTVVTTWEISFEAIRSEDPEAAQILLLCSFLSNDDIDPGFLSRGLPEKFASGKHYTNTYDSYHPPWTDHLSKRQRLMTIFQLYFHFLLRLESKTVIAFQFIPLFIHGLEKDFQSTKRRN